MTYFEVENIGGPFAVNTSNPVSSLPAGQTKERKVIVAAGIPNAPREVTATSVNGRTFCTPDAIAKGRSPC